MRIFSFILVLAALVTIVTGAAFSTDDKCGTGMGCGKPAQLAARDLTNAERLRRGLPLKSPFLRRGAFIFAKVHRAAYPLSNFRLL